MTGTVIFCSYLIYHLEQDILLILLHYSDIITMIWYAQKDMRLSGYCGAMAL